MYQLLVFAALLAVSGTAVNILPSRSWAQEINNNLWLHYLLAHVICSCLLGVYILRGRRRLLSVVLVIPNLLGMALYGTTLWPYISAQDSGVVPAGAPLSVLYANLYSGNPTKEKFLKLVEERNPDVVAVVEMTPAWELVLEPLKSRYPFQRIVSESSNFGVALYSRFAFAGDVVTSVGTGLPAVIIQELELSDAVRVMVYVVHTYPPVSAATHSENYVILRRLASQIKHDDRPTILVGDLNATPFSRHLSLFDQAGLRDVMHGRGAYRTWNANTNWLRFKIDYIFYKGGIAPREAGVLGPIGSDHFPLFSVFSVPDWHYVLPDPTALHARDPQVR